MKIIKLQAQNIKRLRAVEIEPTGNVTMITGKNGQGKSSVLDSIVYAICGKDALPSKPIRDGEESASVVVDLDGEAKLKITRTFTESNSYLTVTNADGFKASSPQSILDKLIGKVSIFDPTKLMAMTPIEQREMLLGLVGADLSAFDRKISELRLSRTQINSEKKTLDVNLAATPKLADAPKSEVDFAALTDNLTQAQLVNDSIQSDKSLIEKKKSEVELTRVKYAQIEKEISGHKKVISDLELQKEKLKESGNEIKQSIDKIEKGLKIPVDTGVIAQQIKDAQSTNQKVRQNVKHQEIAFRLAEISDKYTKLGNQIKEQEDGKVKLLTDCKMPVPGLSADDNGLIYNGVPLQQASESEQLKVCVSIAMAMSPKLRVIRITGNGLDSESMKIVSDMATTKDYQLWVEKVDESGQVGIVIEDGQVKGAK
jgi:DNA repair exonuclease SbcCD ATPase subunit